MPLLTETVHFFGRLMIGNIKYNRFNKIAYIKLIGLIICPCRKTCSFLHFSTFS